MLDEMISLLKDSDELIANNTFEFAVRISSKELPESKIKSFYRILIQDFINLKDEPVHSVEIEGFEGRKRVKAITSIKLVPLKEYSFNLIEPTSYNLPVREVEDWAIQNYGSFEEYNSILNTALDSIEN